MDPIKAFEGEVRENIRRLSQAADFQAVSREWVSLATQYRYIYNFRWLGRPIIQLPQDILALQEIIWATKPDCIIETGVAHGGSLILHASLLQLIGGDRRVIGVDIDIRAHNRKEIEGHFLAPRIQLVQGSSIDSETARQVAELVEGYENFLVILDSNHTESHVLEELEIYSPYVKKGGYLVVYDTAIEDVPDSLFPDRPWGKGDNPKTAVHKFLKQNDRFEIDADIHNKLLLTAAPDGYLRCVR